MIFECRVINHHPSSKAAEPEVDNLKVKEKEVYMCEYKLNWSPYPVAEAAIQYGGSAEFVQDILFANAKVVGSPLGTVPAILKKQYTTGGIKL